MKLALRPTAATKSTLVHRVTTAVIRAVLATDFPHAGIEIGGKLYHSNAEHGLHVSDFDPEKWVLIDLGNNHDTRVLELFEKYKGAHYDYVELFDFTFLRNILKLVRKIPYFKKQLVESMYCFQWCYLALTGVYPEKRVTAETLLLLVARMTAKVDLPTR